MISLALKEVRRETHKAFLREPPRHRPLAVIQPAVAVNQYDRRSFAPGGGTRKKTIDDFLAATMRRMHRDNSFSHVVAPGVCRYAALMRWNEL